MERVTSPQSPFQPVAAVDQFIARAAVELGPRAILWGDNAEAVVLDLMQPLPAGWRFRRFRRQARLDNPGRQGTRRTKTGRPSTEGRCPLSPGERPSECAIVGLQPLPAGGSRYSLHRAPRVHHAARRRGGGVAAGGARAATRKIADNWIFRCSFGFSQKPWLDAFVAAPARTWLDRGSNVAIEFRWAEGRRERVAEIAAEFVQLKVDVIVTSATPPALAAKQATAVIPIVFAAASDPVGPGLVASLARPGGNVTGLANQTSDTAGKKLELLREAVPGLRRLAIMANVGNPASVLEMGEVQATARTLGLEVTTSEIRRAEDIAPAFEALKDRADALYFVPTRS